MATGIVPTDVVYPESDGQPVAETDTHRDLLFGVVARLKAWFAGDPTVYVSGNLFVYYEEGNPLRVLAPDCFVAFGVGNHNRETYKTWEEGRFPAVVFEFTSRSTMREDLRTKLGIYQNVWKVREYFLFDPFEEYLEPSLLGYRMTRGELRPIKPVNGVLTSKTLGITLRRDGTRLILADAATGAELLTKEEAEVARLKAELAALRKRKK